MARARNIKPKFFQNDELGDLPPLARLLFIGLWTIADFKGCLEFRPKRIKTQLLPYDECDIEVLSNYLDKSGFISIYSVQGQRYVKVLKFDQHQTPHKNERDAGSEIPGLEKKDNEISKLNEFQINPDKNGTDPAESLFLNPESFNLNPESGFPSTTTPQPEKPKATPTALPDWIDHDSWQAFIAMRKSIKKPITPAAVPLAIAKLAKLRASGNDPRAVLEQSTLNSWQGLFEVQGQNQARASPSYQTANEKAKDFADRLTGKKRNVKPDDFTIIDINDAPSG